MRYYITYTDTYGEMHQLAGAYEATDEAEAIAQMLADSGADDDGRWTAFEVTDESDVI